MGSKVTACLSHRESYDLAGVSLAFLGLHFLEPFPELCLTWSYYPKGQASGLSWVPGTQSCLVTLDSWYMISVSTHTNPTLLWEDCGYSWQEIRGRERRKHELEEREQSSAQEKSFKPQKWEIAEQCILGLAGKGQGGDQLCGFLQETAGNR